MASLSLRSSITESQNARVHESGFFDIQLFTVKFFNFILFFEFSLSTLRLVNLI